MKRKVIFKENVTSNGKEMKITETEVEVRDLSHLDAQIRFKSQVFKPKKGKGSYKRKPKYEHLVEE